MVEQIDRGRAAATRFEAPPFILPENLEPVDEPLLGGPAAEEGPKITPAHRSPRAGGLGADKKPEPQESYTNRLLKAKQKVWEDRDKDQDTDRGNPS